MIIATFFSLPAAYFATDWVISKFKLSHRWQHFLSRYIVANMVGKFIIVAVTYPINFSEIYSMSTILKLILHTWVFKVIVATVLSPIAMLLAQTFKKIEKVDTYDYGISYNPVRVFNDQQQGENRYHETIPN